MGLGEKLLKLRKKKQLSQEEVADILNVSRQTVSKWETDASIPDLDKILPLCNLYGITSDELLGKEDLNECKNNSNANELPNEDYKKKRAIGISLSVFMFFISIVWIMISIPVMKINPIVASGIFLLICGIGTFIIIYTSIMYKEKKKSEDLTKNKLRKQIESILSIITVIIYLIISFVTMAWHITWIIWVIYGLICEILKLIFMLKGLEDEE